MPTESIRPIFPGPPVYACFSSIILSCSKVSILHEKLCGHSPLFSTTSGSGKYLTQPPVSPAILYHLVSLEIFQVEVRPQFTLPELQEPLWRPFSRLERRGRCSPLPLFSGSICSLLVALSERLLPSAANQLMWVNLRSPVASFRCLLFDKFFLVQMPWDESYLRERALFCLLSKLEPQT